MAKVQALAAETRSKTNSRVIQLYCKSIMKTKSKNPSTLGQEFFYGISKRRNYRKAFPYLLDAAALGYVHAQNLVGYCYSLGLGVTKSKKAAAFWYKQAANLRSCWRVRSRPYLSLTAKERDVETTRLLPCSILLIVSSTR